MYWKKLLGAAAVASTMVFGAQASFATTMTTVDLGFAVDGSGSVSSSDFTLQVEGLAAALAQIPTSGDVVYRISVVSFSATAVTEVPVTVIDSPATLASVISTVENITQANSLTAIGSAIDLLTNNFENAAGGLGDTTVFNVATDGENNAGIFPATAAADAAAAGVDSLSFEAVGPGADVVALAALAFPGPAVIVDDIADLPDDILTTSFVLEVDDFDDFEGAISAKIAEVIVDTGGGTPTPAPVPLPAGLPLLLVGLGAFGVMRRKAAA